MDLERFVVFLQIGPSQQLLPHSLNFACARSINWRASGTPRAGGVSIEEDRGIERTSGTASLSACALAASVVTLLFATPYPPFDHARTGAERETRNVFDNIVAVEENVVKEMGKRESFEKCWPLIPQVESFWELAFFLPSAGNLRSNHVQLPTSNCLQQFHPLRILLSNNLIISYTTTGSALICHNTSNLLPRHQN